MTYTIEAYAVNPGGWCAFVSHPLPLIPKHRAARAFDTTRATAVYELKRQLRAAGFTGQMRDPKLC
jgi:hypothetical protein